MKNIVIIGANQGIGLGLLKQLSQQAENLIIATSRTYSGALIQQHGIYTIKCDITCPDSVDNFCTKIRAQLGHIDVLINCAGILHSQDYQPEKSLAQLNSKQLLENYATNAIGHVLLLQKLEKLIAASSAAIVCSLSARIGSITDNHLGACPRI